jgi:hypothetical protein
MKIHTAVFAAVAAALVSTSDLTAQTDSAAAQKAPRWSFLIPSGKIVPTGEQRHVLQRGNVTAFQLAYVARPTFAITSMFGWARSRDVATAGDPKLDVFTYDVGAEVRAPQWLAGKGMTFSPFAGVGAGGRSYNYRKLELDATHNAAAYASVGGEIGVSRVRIRLEARDYVTGFKPLDGAGESRTGNDVVVMAGLRLVLR